MPVGLFEMAPYSCDTLEMKPGDTMVLYSDGVTEAHNVAGEEFGEERMVAGDGALPPRKPPTVVLEQADRRGQEVRARRRAVRRRDGAGREVHRPAEMTRRFQCWVYRAPRGGRSACGLSSPSSCSASRSTGRRASRAMRSCGRRSSRQRQGLPTLTINDGFRPMVRAAARRSAVWLVVIAAGAAPPPPSLAARRGQVR